MHHTHIHTCTHTHIYMHTHTYTHAHAHTHTAHSETEGAEDGKPPLRKRASTMTMLSKSSNADAPQQASKEDFDVIKLISNGAYGYVVVQTRKGRGGEGRGVEQFDTWAYL